MGGAARHAPGLARRAVGVTPHVPVIHPTTAEVTTMRLRMLRLTLVAVVLRADRGGAAGHGPAGRPRRRGRAASGARGWAAGMPGMRRAWGCRCSRPSPGSPPVTVIVADGVVYVACNGKLIADEAKTLKELARGHILGAPQAPDGPDGTPVATRAAGGPPPAAP